MRNPAEKKEPAKKPEGASDRGRWLGENGVRNQEKERFNTEGGVSSRSGGAR